MIYNLNDFNITYVLVTHKYFLSRNLSSFTHPKRLLNVYQENATKIIHSVDSKLHSILPKQKSLFCLYSQNW